MCSSVLSLKRTGTTVVLTFIVILCVSCVPSRLQNDDTVYYPPTVVMLDRVSSQATLVTPAPVEPRSEVITYVVQASENLFSIADEFGLQPETVLRANETVLSDNPRNVKPGVELIIPPVDGIHYMWRRGDDLNKVAERFGVTPEAILSWPGNQLDSQNLNIDPGTWLIIPGGHRPLTNSNGVTINPPVN